MLWIIRRDRRWARPLLQVFQCAGEQGLRRLQCSLLPQRSGKSLFRMARRWALTHQNQAGLGRIERHVALLSLKVRISFGYSERVLPVFRGYAGVTLRRWGIETTDHRSRDCHA